MSFIKWIEANCIDAFCLTLKLNNSYHLLNNINGLQKVLKKYFIKEVICDGIDERYLEPVALALQGTEVLSLTLESAFNQFPSSKILIQNLKESPIEKLKLRFFYEKDYTHFQDLQHTKIKDLTLYSCEVKSRNFDKLAQALNKTQVTTFNLSCNCIDDSALQSLLGNFGKITTLTLSYCQIYNDIVALWAPYLAATEINTLNLNWNSLNKQGIHDLLIYLKDTKVTTLNLSGNYIDGEDNNDWVYLLKTTNIEVLNCDISKLSKDCLDTLAGQLCHTKIKEFSIAGNYFNLDQLDKLFQCLKATQIKNLNLGYNDINFFFNDLDKLKALKNIEVLDLSHVSLDSYFSCLILSLEQTNLKSLRLSYSKICDEEIKSLFSSIERTKISALDLSYNYLSSKAIEFLMPFLSTTTIRDLNLEKNQIDDVGIMLLANALPSMKIKKINLKGNPIDELGIKALEMAIVPGEVSAALEINLSGAWSKLINQALKKNELFSRLRNPLVSIALLRKSYLAHGIKTHPYLYIQQLEFILSDKISFHFKNKLVHIIEKQFEKSPDDVQQNQVKMQSYQIFSNPILSAPQGNLSLFPNQKNSEYSIQQQEIKNAMTSKSCWNCAVF